MILFKFQIKLASRYSLQSNTSVCEVFRNALWDFFLILGTSYLNSKSAINWSCMKRIILAFFVSALVSTSCNAFEVPTSLMQKIGTFLKSIPAKVGLKPEEDVNALKQFSPSLETNLKTVPVNQFDSLSTYSQSRESVIANGITQVLRNTCTSDTSECRKKIQEIRSCIDKEYQPPRLIETAVKICDK